jgi:DNA-binding response OmpR family regulator
MRILIIDDEEDFADALARGLRKESYAVDVALNGNTGWEMAEVNEYDVLILDLNLPDLDGLEVCKRIRSTHSELLILMLTARNHPTQKIKGLDLGADDYLVKPFHFGELCARLRALLRREAQVRDSTLYYRDLKLDPIKKAVWKNEQSLDLTNKEFGILEYLLRHPAELVTQEKLLEHVWDVNANPFTTSVRVHINSLRRKLGDNSKENLYIETVKGRGYRLGLSSNLIGNEAK